MINLYSSNLKAAYIFTEGNFTHLILCIYFSNLLMFTCNKYIQSLYFILVIITLRVNTGSALLKTNKEKYYRKGKQISSCYFILN